MPVYEYKCLDCEMVYDVFYTSQRSVIEEEPKEQCPKCDSIQKEKLVSKNTDFILKGSGWAKDGYSK